MSKKYLSNAFSIQMLPVGQLGFLSVSPVDISDIPAQVESCIGHSDTAVVVSEILGREVPCNRASISLEEGDILYVAQVVGGRLPEGATSLPEGIELNFIKVEFAGRLCADCRLTSDTACIMCHRSDFFLNGRVTWVK